MPLEDVVKGFYNGIMTAIPSTIIGTVFGAVSGFGLDFFLDQNHEMRFTRIGFYSGLYISSISGFLKGFYAELNDLKIPEEEGFHAGEGVGYSIIGMGAGTCLSYVLKKCHVHILLSCMESGLVAAQAAFVYGLLSGYVHKDEPPKVYPEPPPKEPDEPDHSIISD